MAGTSTPYKRRGQQPPGRIASHHSHGDHSTDTRPRQAHDMSFVGVYTGDYALDRCDGRRTFGESAYPAATRGHRRSGARRARSARARRRLQARLRHPGQPRLLDGRRAVRREVPGPLYVLRVRSAGIQPARAGRRPGLHGRASRGGGEQAGQPRHVHHALRAVRGDVRPGAGGPGPAAPVLRRGRGAGRRERAQDRV